VVVVVAAAAAINLGPPCCFLFAKANITPTTSTKIINYFYYPRVLAELFSAEEEVERGK
jgi:hypothetical protein